MLYERFFSKNIIYLSLKKRNKKLFLRLINVRPNQVSSTIIVINFNIYFITIFLRKIYIRIPIVFFNDSLECTLIVYRSIKQSSNKYIWSFISIYEEEPYLLLSENKDEIEHYLLLNGSIYLRDSIPRMMMPGVDYCMEIIPTLGLVTVVCFSKDDKILMADTRIIFYASGLLISVPFLILTIIAFSITPRLRDVYGKILCHYCGCLAVAFTGLAITQLGGVHWEGHTCICIAFVIQFSFIACYFWLNAMCIETWLLIRNHVHHGAYQRIKPNVLFFYYSIWAWGFSGIFILLSIVMDLNPTIPTIYIKPNFFSDSDSCWFKSDTKTMPFFFIPVGLLLLVNLIFFILTGITIRRYQKDLALRRLARNQESDRQDQRMFRSLKRTFIVCIVLYSLMSLTWTMELISWWTGGNPFDWSVYDLVNALQGLLVFGLFVLRRPARDFIWCRIQKLRGIDVVEPQTDTAAFSLLTVIN
uniref:G-protein coupled receptor Mth2-like isoform X2 n=1 Tax=Vespula vulgaris TaxID=7454 RepID=UPI00223A9BE1|nr:G-protein coupled receptor Mth2-like isoform X2 [Vespula vulgaris]